MRFEERELRFTVERNTAESFLACAADHASYDVYDTDRPIAFSRTTYFAPIGPRRGTPDTSGLERRVRIREYGAAAKADELPSSTGLLYFEVKQSRETERTKSRVSIDASTAAALVERTPLEPGFHAQLAQRAPFQPVLTEWTAGALRPCLVTQYRRLSLSTPSIRITLDEDVAVFRPRETVSWDVRSMVDGPLGYVPGRILEVKIRGDTPAWLADAMKNLPDQHSNSKFVIGMRAMRIGGRALRQRGTGAVLAIPRSE